MAHLPAEDELASTIEELTRKLDDVNEEDVRQELRRFLDHGVPLHQAKQDLLQTLSGTSSSPSAPRTGSVEKKIDEIETSDQNVDLTAKVLSVAEREITARGEQKIIWSGLLGDETGSVQYTSWVDHDLEPMDVLRIENAYVTTWQNDPQVNIGDHARVEPTDTPIEVPTEATRGPETDVGDLEDGMSSVSITGRVLDVTEREVDVKGEPRSLWEGEIADESGRIPYTAWHDYELAEGDVLRIENAYVRSFRGLPQLNFGENATVTREDDDAVPPATELSDVEGPEVTFDHEDIGDLAPGMNSVAVTGRVLEVAQRDIQVEGEPRTLWEGEIADESGRIPYTAWHDHDLSEGDVVEIENAYVRSFRGLPQLNFGENATVTREDDDAVPPATELQRARETTIGDLHEAQGAVGVRVEPVVIEIREGSGLIMRCPECRRVLRQSECQMHGRVEGVPDLRVKAIVDDGTGALLAILDRQRTEQLLGKSLDECRELADEAMTYEVIADEVQETVLMKRIRLEGNATFDDYGTTFLVKSFELLEPEGIEERAEAMIEKVHALSEDVQAVEA